MGVLVKKIFWPSWRVKRKNLSIRLLSETFFVRLLLIFGSQSCFRSIVRFAIDLGTDRAKFINYCSFFLRRRSLMRIFLKPQTFRIQTMDINQCLSGGISLSLYFWNICKQFKMLLIVYRHNVSGSDHYY